MDGDGVCQGDLLGLCIFIAHQLTIVKKDLKASHGAVDSGNDSGIAIEYALSFLLYAQLVGHSVFNLVVILNLHDFIPLAENHLSVGELGLL